VKLLRVRLVVEDFPAALRFYATLMEGACVTKAPDVDAAPMKPQAVTLGTPLDTLA
jgi:hypothetical protein